MTTPILFIPLTKLALSLVNARRTGAGIGLEELAASIAAHGLLQNLQVRSVLDGEGQETSRYEVVAGARRLAAMKLLANCPAGRWRARG
jgi:ParB family chromosome partitioning protein